MKMLVITHVAGERGFGFRLACRSGRGRTIGPRFNRDFLSRVAVELQRAIVDLFAACAFLSTTRLNERVAIRFAIGNARTTPADVRETWDLLVSTARRLAGT